MIATTARCFARNRPEAGKRRGVWVMTKENRGVFYHGDREETQAPQWDISDLKVMDDVVEITPEEALKELENCPECKAHMERTFARHPSS